MNTLDTVGNDALTLVPYDYATAVQMPDWREGFGWPHPVARSSEIATARTRALIENTLTCSNEQHQMLLLLSGAATLTSSLALVDMAHAVERENDLGIQYVGDIPELKFLRFEIDEDGLPPARGYTVFKPPAAPKLVALRRLVRTATWTPWWRLPQTMLAAKATAISHNELLVEVAKETGADLRYHHAETLVAEGYRKAGASYVAKDVEKVVPLLTDCLVESTQLSVERGQRLRTLIERQARSLIGKAEQDLHAMRHISSLPKTVWAGTGGYWPGRALSLEIRRRGGHITRFDHGFNRAINNAYESFVWAELLVSDRVYLPTRQIAARLANAKVRELLAGRPCEIVGHHGESPLTGFHKRTHTPRPLRGRPNVLFAPNILRGLRQSVPASPADLVYLDWQYRLIDQLRTMPIELTVRPHPEGIFRGKPHPLSETIELADKNFEQLIETTDIFLFDSPISRTFPEALVTDRPIVFLDVGTPYIAEELQPLLNRRCRIIRLSYNERGLPIVDPAVLEEALRDATPPDQNTVDELNRLLLGEATA